MITSDILKLINEKLNSIITYLMIIGMLFFILATAVLIYPQIIQIIFVLVFFICSFSAFLIAVKISNIKDIFHELLSFNKKK